MFSKLLRRLGVDRGSPGRARSGRFRLSGALAGMLCTLLAAPAWSLGLGEIELDSALNERLKAEIELLDASGLQPSEIVVSLGSAEDFRRVGVERFFFLTDLRFEVDYAGGGAVVKVTSGQPITEPYLNFLIEVLWPQGRLLKEFTLLLDPPTFSQAAAPVVQRPALSAAPSQSAGRVQRTPAQASPRPQPARSSGTQVQLDAGAASGPSPLDEGIVDGEYRMTDRNDTLWDIASATLPGSGITVQQNMLALQRLNPDAFIGGNINLLKAGYVLRLPSEAEARALTAAAANQEVAQQNQAWRTGTPVQVAANDGATAGAPAGAPQGSGGAEDLRPQVDASSRGDGPAASAAAQSGELRIVAGAGDSATGQGGPDGEVLNAALEEQDRLAREVDELTYQLDREKELAASQIEVKERQLEVKDQQIAELQAQLEQLREQNQLAQTPPPAQQTQTASRQAAQAPWWQSPYVMYGGAGVLVLLLVGGMVASRRRRAPEDEDFYAEEGAVAFDEPAGAGGQRIEPAFEEAELGADAARAQDTLLDEEEIDEGEDILALDESDEQAGDEAGEDAAPRDSETGDVIGEADIYIAYGRYPQAIGLLLGVLESSPERNDVRLKLLEVYADVKDRDGFDTHLAQLVEYCDDEDALLTARDLESSFGDDEGGPAADDDPRSSNIDYEPPTTADADELETLTLDDDGLGDEDLTQAATAAGVEAAAEEPDSTLDFELELDELETAADAGAAPVEDAHAGAGDELGGDLGMNFDPERDVDESLEEDSSASGPVELDTDELSLDDVLDDDSSVEFEPDSSSEVATAAEDEFEFDEEGDSASTKLDLARAYIDMGDADGARDILQEVVGEGTSEQRQQAQALLDSI